MTIIYTNGHACETGCVLDNHHGWHNHARMIEVATDLGWDISSEDWATVTLYDSGESDPDSNDPEIVNDLMDAAERWLNDNTSPTCHDCGSAMYATSDGFYRHTDYANGRTPCGTAATDSVQHYVWHWHDGDFCLSPICDDGDCDDDTCAHWA